MAKITIKGDGNIVGDKNVVISSIQKNLQNDKLLELDKAFEVLRQEIINLSTISEKARNQTIRAIEDAEEEASDETANVGTIKNSLERVKDTLEDAGEVYDSAKSWGKRLSDLAKTLIKYFPTIVGWVRSL
jgi:flagellin-like hook-associated protein FlgL